MTNADVAREQQRKINQEQLISRRFKVFKEGGVDLAEVTHIEQWGPKARDNRMGEDEIQLDFRMHNSGFYLSVVILPTLQDSAEDLVKGIYDDWTYIRLHYRYQYRDVPVTPEL